MIPVDPYYDSYQAMSNIAAILYPHGDRQHEWEVADLEKIAAIVNEWLLFD